MGDDQGITLKPANDRGFLRGEWSDLYGQPCRIQKSSLATIDAIWLGSSEGAMHLDRWQAAILVDQLQHFIRTGQLRHD